MSGAPGYPAHRRVDLVDALGTGGAYLFIAALYLSPADLWPVTAPLRPAMLAAAAMIAAVLIRRVTRGEPLRLAGGLGAALILLFTVLLLSPLWSLSPGGSLGYALGTVKLAAAFVGLAGTLRTPEKLRRAATVAVISSIVPAWMTIQHWRSGIDLVEGFRGTYMGLLANPNQLAAVMALTAPFALAGFLRARGGWKLVYLAALGLEAGAMVVTHSRGGALAFVAAMLVAAVLSRRRLAAFSVVAVAAVALLLFAPSSFFDRTRSISAYETDASARGRILAWETGWRALEASPLLGVGAGAYLHAWDLYTPRNVRERAYASHNMWMQVAVETGLLGAGAFLAMLLLAARGLWRARGGPWGAEARALLAGLAALAVSGFTAGNAFHWFTYLVLGLAGALVAQARVRAPAREADGVRLAAA